MGAPRRGDDLRIDLSLTFEEAAEGCERTVDIVRTEPCEPCAGVGIVGAVIKCLTCMGTARVERPQGFSMVRDVCPACRGTGKGGDRCRACDGGGLVQRARATTIKVPAGVDDGWTLRLDNQGDVGPGGAGCLYVVMTVERHPRFERRGDDLHVDVAITKALATSGGRAVVPLLVGEREVDVPPSTKSGDTFVLRGCGIQRAGAPPTPVATTSGDAPYRELDTHGRGDLVVTWKLDEQRGFLRRLFRP